MSILEIIKARRSVRKYKADPLPPEVFGRVMEAARMAPSGKNLQPWKFIVVRDKETKERLALVSRGQMFIAQAPVILVACGFPELSYQRQGNYMQSWTIDVACAIDHLMLQACQEGLGTCWIGAFEEKEVKPILHVPAEVRVLALTPLGYPDETPKDRGRKDLSEILTYDSF